MYHHMNCSFYDEDEEEDNEDIFTFDPDPSKCECQEYTDFGYAFESPEYRTQKELESKNKLKKEK